MKKEDVPQDKSSLVSKNIKELYYATDENGNYTTELSSGWEAKTIALESSMDTIKEREEDALRLIEDGQASPLLYFMEKSKMDLPILAGYVGMWQWRVKRHLKASVFNRLSDRVLSKYAEAFEISLDTLKNFSPNK